VKRARSGREAGARRLGPLATCAVLLLPGVSAAAVTLHLDAESRFDTAPALRLTASNMGDEAAHDAVPEVLFQHRTYLGERATLAPGARREWLLSLAAPRDRGTFPAIVRVRFADAHGERGSTPLVTLVRTPDATPSPVSASLRLEPLAGAASGELRLENAGLRPVAGRLAVILPDALHTYPESQPVEVAARGRAMVPLVIQDAGARPGGQYPLFAVLEYTEDGAHHAALAAGTVTVAGNPTRGRVPLLVGLLALSASLALLAVAWRRAARRG